MNRFLSVLGLLGLIACAGTHAQSISVVKLSFKNLPSSYRIGEPIYLKPAELPPASLHVRVFFGSKADLLTRKADSLGCVRYYTWVLYGIGEPGNINLDAINDVRLLRKTPSGEWKSSTVTLVFEASSGPEPGQFWLHSDHEQLERYFHYGLEIQLDPPDPSPVYATPGSSAASATVANLEKLASPHLACFSVDTQYVTGAQAGMGAGLEIATVKPGGCRDAPIASGELAWSTGQGSGLMEERPVTYVQDDRPGAAF
jgi:hypothetical protein